jgi:hypothetical protein
MPRGWFGERHATRDLSYASETDLNQPTIEQRKHDQIQPTIRTPLPAHNIPDVAGSCPSDVQDFHGEGQAVKIIHQVHDIGEVMAYFAEGFQLKKGQRVAMNQTNYDPRTGKVVFFFYCDDEDEQPNRKFK